MKKILLSFLLTLFLFWFIISFAANDEPVCGNVNCVYGYCDQNSMSCVCNENRVWFACDTLYCPDGTIESWEWTYCEPCPAWSYESWGVCLACNDWLYSSTGSLSCLLCSPGTISNASHTSCEPCPSWTFTSWGSCVSCGLGEYSSTWALSCMTCPSGTQADVAHMSCFSCSVGQYGSGWVCMTCSWDTYSESQGAAQCLDCPYWTMANSWHTGCVDELWPVVTSLVSARITDLDPCTWARLSFTGHFSFADLWFTGYALVNNIYYPLYGTSFLYIWFAWEDFGITWSYISTRSGVSITVPYIVVNSGTLSTLSWSTDFIITRPEVCPRVIDDISLSTVLLPGWSTFNGWSLSGFIISPPNSNTNPQTILNPGVKKQKKKRIIVIPKLNIGLQLPGIWAR